MKYVEITEQAFKLLLGDKGVREIVELEHARKCHYFNNGVRLLTINTFIDNIRQYYVADINS